MMSVYQNESSAAPNLDFFAPRLLAVFPRVLPPRPRPRLVPLDEVELPRATEAPLGHAVLNGS